MTTISGTSGGHAGWSRAHNASNKPSGSSRADKMFAKADADGSGSVDKTELQSMLDKIAEKSGNSLGSADDLMTKMDTDGNGSLSKDELATGMKSLMPPPSSTVDFAQQCNGTPPPPPPSDDNQNENDSALQRLFAAADTDGDKTISQSEADALKQKMDAVIQSLQDGSSTSSTSSSSTGSDASGFNLSAFVDQVLKQYAQGAASSTAASATTALSVTA